MPGQDEDTEDTSRLLIEFPCPPCSAYMLQQIISRHAQCRSSYLEEVGEEIGRAVRAEGHSHRLGEVGRGAGEGHG